MAFLEDVVIVSAVRTPANPKKTGRLLIMSSCQISTVAVVTCITD